MVSVSQLPRLVQQWAGLGLVWVEVEQLGPGVEWLEVDMATVGVGH